MMKYMGIKLTGCNNWLWFLVENIIEDSASGFSAKMGWSNNATVDKITIDSNLIEGRVWASTILINE